MSTAAFLPTELKHIVYSEIFGTIYDISERYQSRSECILQSVNSFGFKLTKASKAGKKHVRYC